MKNLFTLTVFVLLAGSLLSSRQAVAQAPDKMSYQAVIRDASGGLVTEQEIGMKISILQGSVFGASVYIETQSPVTNENGLVTIVIGNGEVVHGTFSGIDWSAGPWFIKTETDPSGGTTYTISGTSQLLSVPYAFHAKTAETITEPIVESDPVFDASPAAGIEAADIGNWDEAYSWGDHAGEGYLTEESDPLFTAWDKSTGIEITESQISDLQTYYLASNPDGSITTYIVNEEDVTAHESALSISESQITDLQSYLTSITGQSVGNLADVDLTGIAAGKVLKYDAVEEKWVVADDLGLTEESDPTVPAHVKAITTDNIADWNETHLWGNHADGGYITTETDPTFTATFSITDPADGDLLRYNDATDKWEKYTPDYAAGTHVHTIATDEADGFISAADKEKLDGLGGSLSIGDSHQGGIIFWLDASGEHGLIAASEDQSTGIQWYNGAYTWTTAFASAVGAGYGNTRMIVYQQGAGAYAAQLCRDLSLGGYNDWYLPSKYELNLMYQNIGQGNLLGLGNVGGFASTSYCSSTEYSISFAWRQSFNDGYQDYRHKSTTYRVRAVRAF